MYFLICVCFFLYLYINHAAVSMRIKDDRSDYLHNADKYSKSSFFKDVMITSVGIEEAIKKMNTNSAPGCDNIVVEHFKYAHPSLLVILKSIFNIFISLGEVPSDFGLGIVVPIPKFKGHKYNVTADDFRGITLTPVASKIFEDCISPVLKNLFSSERQFGFKENHSCPQAINIVKNTINYFQTRGNTVNVCGID